MTLHQKVRLFLRLGTLPSVLAIVLLLLCFGRLSVEIGLADASPGGLRMTVVLSELLMLGIPVALVFSYLKFRRGLLALNRGKRVQATVKRVRLHRHRNKVPSLYALDWVDEDGASGSSLPGIKKTFDGLQAGNVITVYRNNWHDSWWERDILGN